MNKSLNSLRVLAQKLFEDYPIADAIVATVAVVLGVYLNWPVVTALIFGVFIWAMLRPVASGLLAKTSLAALGGVALLLLAGRDDRAETMAAMGYYLLVITVIVLIRERRNGNDYSD